MGPKLRYPTAANNGECPTTLVRTVAGALPHLIHPRAAVGPTAAQQHSGGRIQDDFNTKTVHFHVAIQRSASIPLSETDASSVFLQVKASHMSSWSRGADSTKLSKAGRVCACAKRTGTAASVESGRQCRSFTRMVLSQLPKKPQAVSAPLYWSLRTQNSI